MKKIDTTSWRQFCVGELFDILGGKGITKQEIYEHPGSLPAIQSGEENFGRIGYLDKDYCITKKYAISKGECLTVARSGSSGYVGYQASQCVVGDSAKILEPKFESNTLRLLFVRSALMVLKARYAYTDKVTNENYAKAIILLPAKNEEPDWQYMEEYMRHIEQHVWSSISARVKSSVLALKDTNYRRVSINTSYWKPYEIGKLFDKLDLPFLKKEFNKAYDVSLEKSDEFSLPLVNAKHSNNGIMYYGRESDFASAEMTIDIVADGAASTGDVYPQPQRTGVLYNAYLIKLKDDTTKASKWVLFFLSSIIEKSVKQKYGYDEKCTWDKVRREKILLPATPSGDPDWHYMEMYMRGVEAIVKNKLSLLVPHKTDVSIKNAASVTFNNANVTYIDQSKTYNVK